MVSVLRSFRPALLKVFMHYAAVDKAASAKSKASLQTVNEVEFQQAPPCSRAQRRAKVNLRPSAPFGVGHIFAGIGRAQVFKDATLLDNSLTLKQLGTIFRRQCATTL